MWLKLLVIFITFKCGLCQGGVFQQQYFRVVPRSTKVLEGHEAVLECEVSNLAGQVQWAKDGFALGFASIIPGYPRYSMVGDRRNGVFNLRIVNASLEDDAEFQCQVGPANMHKVIRANATLSVVSPPSSVEIIGHPHNSKLEIKEGTEITLECLVKNAKPAAKIVWYRANIELKLDRREDEVIEIEPANGHRKNIRYTTKSRIHMKPTSEDDYTDFACEAKHESLQRDFPMRSSIQLSVLYPPGAPYIEGYADGETVRRGQTVELVCRSRGGNPPAQLIWYKNGEQIRMAYRTTGRVSENVLTFTADASDNKARYRCEAKNIMISNTLKSEVDLTVLFAPSHVTITGPAEARVGDPVPLTCTTAPSNPPAEIKWMVIGKHYKDATSKTSISPEGGWTTTSNITVIVEPNRRSIVVVCHGLNMQLTENVVSTHTINVLYPPSAPIVSGYKAGTALAAGTVQKLLCISTGGNPLATLTWYKNDKKIHSTSKATDRSVTAEISILTNVTDNLAQYRCEATNSATEIPLFETVTLNVHFAPEAVKIHVEPQELKIGFTARLICDAASSNPPAVLSWWRDGIPVDSSPAVTKPGLHGGTVSSLELRLDVTKDLNGAIYTCQAMNEILQRSVHDAHQLRVLYPPVFEPVVPTITVGVENEPFIIMLRADGNPSNVVYTWTKGGLPITQIAHSNGNERILSEGGHLNITTLLRTDAGVYTCEATNSQGSVRVNVTLDVQYGASIKSISETPVVEPNQDVTLSCTANGNPITEDTFQWHRANFDFTRTSTEFDSKSQTSFIHVKQVTRSDVGFFDCKVNNGIGEDSVRQVGLLVKFKPEIDVGPEFVKSAANTGDVARLKCRCKSVPAPNFSWSRNGATISANTSTKHYVEYHKIDEVTYMSVLLVSHVTSHEYGNYECMARNEMGFSTGSVKLDVTSPPDPIASLKVTNVTHNSVTLEWIPGFDGGMQASYRIRYRKLYDAAYKYEDVTPMDTRSYTIDNLEMATDYLFSIMAINDLGQSKYRPDDTKATTLSSSDNNELTSGVVASSQPIESMDVSKTIVVYVSIAGVVLVVANLALIAYFLLKRRAKRIKEQATQSSKSATIEMYAPSSYNDTLNGETLSSVSEKSETYSNEDMDHNGMMDIVPDVPAMPNRRMLSDQYNIHDEQPMIETIDYPPPNYISHTLPHPPHRRAETHMQHTLGRNTPKQVYVNAPSPMPPLDGSYYNMSSDRYLSYPPMISEYNTDVPIVTSPVTTSAPLQSSGSPPPNYVHEQMTQTSGGGGTLRRQRFQDKMAAAVPPPDVTVLHASCNQKHARSPPQVETKQPQSILKDSSRQKYSQYNNVPLSTSSPLNNTNQILTVQNLTATDIPQYGTIRKEKKNNVTIDETYNTQTHVV